VYYAPLLIEGQKLLDMKRLLHLFPSLSAVQFFVTCKQNKSQTHTIDLFLFFLQIHLSQYYFLGSLMVATTLTNGGRGG
jgi:hypothetical protein